jgi:hypothetical protein
MPEMIAYCGREFTVLKRIDKVNDTVDRTGLRRMKNAVILDGVRCDGSAHGGCQAQCQLIFNEAWLTRVRVGKPDRSDPREGRPTVPPAMCTEARLVDVTRRPSSSGNERFSCQATEIRNASSYLAWWDPRQYLRDLWFGNVSVGEMVRAFGFWIFRVVLQRARGYTVMLALYDRIQALRGGEPYPYRRGRLTTTPRLRLDLRSGELVEVKRFGEIRETLDVKNRNRGLSFDVEMTKYCGGTYRVLSRVEQIIDHKSGAMVRLDNDCIILEGVTTRGDHHRFYPQNEYPFWREIWLRRVPTSPDNSEVREGDHAAKGH